MKRSLKVSVIAIALFGLLGLGGCVSMIPDTLPKAACGVAGGLALHALTGGASSAIRAASTVAGVGGGSALCDKLGK